MELTTAVTAEPINHRSARQEFLKAIQRTFIGQSNNFASGSSRGLGKVGGNIHGIVVTHNGTPYEIQTLHLYPTGFPTTPLCRLLEYPYTTAAFPYMTMYENAANPACREPVRAV